MFIGIIYILLHIYYHILYMYYQYDCIKISRKTFSHFPTSTYSVVFKSIYKHLAFHYNALFNCGKINLQFIYMADE